MGISAFSLHTAFSRKNVSEADSSLFLRTSSMMKQGGTTTIIVPGKSCFQLLPGIFVYNGKVAVVWKEAGNEKNIKGI